MKNLLLSLLVLVAVLALPTAARAQSAFKGTEQGIAWTLMPGNFDARLAAVGDRFEGYDVTTVSGATVIALFPLALHGGPLWEPMCYAQIGGLTAATFITLLLVPVIYSIVVFDLKLVKCPDIAIRCGRFWLSDYSPKTP